MRARATASLVSSLVFASLLFGTVSADPDRDSRPDGSLQSQEAAAAVRRSEHPSHPEPSLALGARRRPAVEENFELLGHVAVPGQQAAADVYFFDHGDAGKFVYLGSYRAPCTSDGVTIVDVTDPSEPQVAAVAPLAEKLQTSTEDVVVEAVGDRVILISGLQACGRRGGGADGIALWDVTDPSNPSFIRKFKTPHGVHELDVVTRPDGTVLALLAVPFLEFENTYFDADFGGEFRIVDITDPAHPVALADWGVIADSDLVTFGGDPIVSSFQGMDSFYSAIYAHSVRAADDGMTAYVSYWDAGIIKLDISDPSNPTFVGRTFYEVGDAGDGHSMFPLDVGGKRYIIQNDEDYSPDSPVTVTSSETGVTRYNGMHEPWMPLNLYDTGAITGEVFDAGDGCQARDYEGAEGKVVLVDTVDPYYVGIIDGLDAPCRIGRQTNLAAASGAAALLSNLVGPDDPYPFPYAAPDGVRRDEDMVIVQIADTDGLAAALRAAAQTPTVTLEASTPTVGYVRIFDESLLTDLDGDGVAQEFTEVARFTEPPFVFDDLEPPARGTWSVHNTEVLEDIAYSSWYSHGIVAWDLSNITQPVMVGQFRPPTRRGWPMVWGVAFDPATGTIYASDIVGGLWIAQPTGPAAAV